MLKNPFQIFKFLLLLFGVSFVIYNLIKLDWNNLFSDSNTGNFLGIVANFILALAMWISLRYSYKNEGKI